MAMARVVIFAVLLLATTGCFSWFGADEESNAVSEVIADDGRDNSVGLEVRSSTGSEIELKLAKLWSRVSELEEQLYRQKEKVRVLEKGLMLGLVPEEMKQEEEPYRPVETVSPIVADKPKAPVQPSSSLNPEEMQEYQAGLAKAHDLYRAGRYGVAIKAFSEVGEKYDAKMADGVTKYWIAKCWVHLKEYSIAHQTLVDLSKEYPGSAFLPRAKLEMARIQVHQGLRESAIENFRMIIDQYPYEDAAEMARMELQRLENTL